MLQLKRWIDGENECSRNKARYSIIPAFRSPLILAHIWWGGTKHHEMGSGRWRAHTNSRKLAENVKKRTHFMSTCKTSAVLLRVKSSRRGWSILLQVVRKSRAFPQRRNNLPTATLWMEEKATSAPAGWTRVKLKPDAAKLRFSQSVLLSENFYQSVTTPTERAIKLWNQAVGILFFFFSPPCTFLESRFKKKKNVQTSDLHPLRNAFSPTSLHLNLVI